MPKKTYPINPVEIDLTPEGMIILRELAKELNVPYHGLYAFLRIRPNISAYIYCHILFVDKKEFMEEWKKRGKQGRKPKEKD